MLKNFIFKIIIFFLIILSFVNYSYGIEAITVPETDVNLRIVNLTTGCKVYILIPTEMLKYNLEKFINNNLDNPYELEDEEAKDLQKLLEKEDYIGYLNYFKEIGFNVADNEMELRHYSFCLGRAEIEDYQEYEGNKYIRIRIYPNYNNEFKLILKDYLNNIDPKNTKFMIDEFNIKTYINVSDYEFITNELHPNIKECNINYTYYTTEDYNAIERNIKIAYWIINIIILILIIITIILIKRHRKKKKEEIEERKFWKKKLTKEELEEKKKKEKEEKKLGKKKKKNKK